MKNSFGNLFRVTTFGESHGAALGAVIDGCPSGVELSLEDLQKNLARRRPGNHGGASGEIVSQRKEEDLPEILSGVFQGKTLGTPIAVLVYNKDQRSEDYDEIAKSPRTGHADDVWKTKFGHVDHRGGGRASGRETVARVIAGTVAEKFLQAALPELKIYAFAQQIGPHEVRNSQSLSCEEIDHFPARFPDADQSESVQQLLKDALSNGKSYGGKVQLVIENAPAGLGQPVFHKLKADLASAMLGIGATSAIDIGDGLEASESEGSEFHLQDSNQYGGIRGGISTGQNIYLNVAFKPTSTVLDAAKKGRHDPCIVPRAIPVVEAMASLVLAEHVLWQRLDQVERSLS